MMRLRASLGLLIWIVLLILAGVYGARELKVSGDLRLFMPAAQSAEQRLLLGQLGEGAASRLLLLSLTGAEPEVLVEHSRELRALLADSPQFALVSNGEDGLESLPDDLLDFRYLLSDGPRQGSLSASGLRRAMQARLADLGSPMASLITPLLPSDPTLETLKVLDAWSPSVEPERLDGVWFSSESGAALLIAETRDGSFDPDAQQRALNVLRETHASLLLTAAELADDPEAAISLEISGPGAFAERMSRQTRSEASWLGGAGGLGLLLLMAFAYRSIWLPLLGALPLLTGAITGLAATALMFDQVHGITLAFGVTLLGIAQDYPTHLFSHRRKGESARQAVKSIWPTMATGAFSSALAYLVFFFAGVDGLRQLAVMTVSGLIAALLATRFLLPPLLPSPSRDLADIALLARLQGAVEQWSYRRSVALGVAVIATAAIVLSPTRWWQDDLAALTPVPAELLMRDAQLRQQLGAPDVRWVLSLRAETREDALRGSEALVPDLDALRATGAIDGYEMAARYLPSSATQAARRSALPSAQTLSASLTSAIDGLPFRPDAFEPFLQSVDRARYLPDLSPEVFASTPLQARIESFLVGQGDEVVALITLSSPSDLAAIRAAVAGNERLVLLDMKEIANSLAASWRGHVLQAMAWGALGLVLLVWAGVGSFSRLLRVLAPVALGTWLVLAVLHGSGVSLTLFHLIALVLGAGLGLDYALFFARDGEDAGARRRTLHAVLVCAGSTLLVFGLLSLSSIPVLQSLGVTVGLCVISHFLLSLLLAFRTGNLEHSGQ